MSYATGEYDGNNMLAVLGQSISSPLFKEFKEFWLLDKSYQNNNRGIKIYINPINDKVESIIVAGEGLEMGGTKFNKCNTAIPFGINLDDDTAHLINKLSRGEKLLGRSTLRFYKNDIAIEASYTDLNTGKIYFLKFTRDNRHAAPVIVVQPEPVKKEDVIEKRRQIERDAFLGVKKETAQPVALKKDSTRAVVASDTQTLRVKRESIIEKRRQEERAVFLTGSTSTKPEQKNELKTVNLKRDTSHARVTLNPQPAPAKTEDVIEKNRRLQQAAFLSGSNPTAATTKQVKEKFTTPLTPFKKAILDVFKASREYSLDSIKSGERSERNFWNYKYTYNSKLKIPGEKYNMLYSFPFVTSQLDFVVVLKESDNYEPAFESLYHSFENQLLQSFPASEGWISSCLPGKDKSHLPDLEFRNDKYGAIILDHTQNPKGRHVLYLRFLLFSD